MSAYLIFYSHFNFTKELERNKNLKIYFLRKTKTYIKVKINNFVHKRKKLKLLN